MRDEHHKAMTDRALLASLGRLAREGAARVTSEADDEAAESRLVAAVASGEGRSSRGRRGNRGVFVGAAAAAALAAGIALYAAWPAAELAASLDGVALASGSYVQSDAPGGARIAFSDGSEVRVTRGASARVEEITSKGARLRLEDGALEASIVPAPGAEWSVDAGPFVVAVKGTRFTAAWSASAQELRVVLDEGSVSVRGPLAPDGVTLVEGQTMTANLRNDELSITKAEPSASAALGAPSAPPLSPSIASPGLGDLESPPPAAPTATVSEVGAPFVSWSKRVAKGDFEGVLREAEQRGVDGVLSGGSLDDLVALSDAARYAGRGDLSRRALLAVRSRFAGSGPATSAAFLLGRMAHDGGSPGGAIQWYDRYLAEAPSGTFASEALGRKMLAVRTTQGTGAARPLAEAYLARYPKGGFAAVAGEIVGQAP